MRRMLRIVKWAVVAIAALALILLAAGVIVLQTPWFRDKVRQRIVYEVERATGGRVEIGAFDLDWRRLTAGVRNLVIHGDEPAGAPPLFRADAAVAELKIVSIFKKQVDIRSAVLTRPRVNLIVYQDGRTNVPKRQVVRKTGRGPVDVILDLAIKRFNLVDGYVQVNVRRTPLQVSGENLRAQIFWEPDPARYRGELSFRQVDVTPGQIKTLAFDVGAKFTLSHNRLEIAGAHLGFKGSALDVRGTLEDFASPKLKLHYAAKVNLADVPAPLRIAALPTRGSLALGGDVAVSQAGGYALRGTLKAAGLAFAERGLKVENVSLSSEVVVSPERIELPNLDVAALGGRLSGTAELVKFERFRVDVAVRGFALQELTHWQGIEHSDWNGTLSGPLRITGVVRRGRVEDLVTRARVTVTPAPGANPVEGLVNVTSDRSAGAIQFERSYFATRHSQVQFSGALGRRMEVAFQSNDLTDVEPAIKLLGGDPGKMPVRLEQGLARFQGAVTGPLRAPSIQGHATLRNFIFLDRKFERVDADVTVSKSGVMAQNLSLDKNGIAASGWAQVGFRNWRPERTEPLAGSLLVKAPVLEVLLAETGKKLPVKGGPVSAAVKLGGTIGEVQAAGQVRACPVVAYDQPFDCVEGQVRYTPEVIGMSSGQVRLGTSQVQVTASFEHPRDDWQNGRLRFQVATRGVPLARIQLVTEQSPGIQGRVETQLAGDIMFEASGFRPAALNGWLALRGLAIDKEPLGSLLLNAATKGNVLNVTGEGELIQAKVKGASRFTLQGDYPVKGHAEFAEMQFSTLLARLGRDPREGPLPFAGFAAGSVDFTGSTVKRESWKGEIRLSALEIRPAPGEAALANVKDLTLRNAGPIVIDADSRGVRIREAHLRGLQTDLDLTGRVAFGVRNPWDLRVRGALNLALLRNFENRLYSSGELGLDVTIRGALRRPDVYGRLDLKNASANLADFPNGIENANGLIFLYRDRATIENLTAESGGGKLALSGFVGFGAATTFHLQARVTDVRVRYPEGVSSTLNATLAYTGTLDRATISGEVLVNRVGFNPRSDLASILARTSEPIQTPQRQGRIWQNSQLDVHIATTPQTRFETQLTKDVQADADLRVRGNLARPAVLGRVAITQGEVLFFGNRYAISAGQVLFVNPAKIEPTVNLDLETKARGIEVILHVTGPIEKLNVSYRSDPPLPFSDIVALLATGREPLIAAPGLSGAQSQVTQSWEQRGATALLGQAIATPIAGRLQRFFGVSRLKIDPQITGGTTNNATARVTLEQQVTSNITFTYITDLSRAQAQTIQVEWDFTRSWSGVALREENGLFGIDFLYKKQFK